MCCRLSLCLLFSPNMKDYCFWGAFPDFVIFLSIDDVMTDDVTGLNKVQFSSLEIFFLNKSLLEKLLCSFLLILHSWRIHFTVYKMLDQPVLLKTCHWFNFSHTQFVSLVFFSSTGNKIFTSETPWSLLPFTFLDLGAKLSHTTSFYILSYSHTPSHRDWDLKLLEWVSFEFLHLVVSRIQRPACVGGETASHVCICIFIFCSSPA